MRLFLALILTGLFCSAGIAQHSQVTRTLRAIDFEERRLGNPEELPMHWTKLQGAGLPHYVNGKLSDDVARSGKYSFRLDLNGGSLIYRYDPRHIRVSKDAHYRVEAFVRTSAMKHARARISAYFVDAGGRTIAETRRSSDPFVGRDGDDWRALAVELTADNPDAALLGVELELLQPAIYAPTSLGRQAVFPQDIRGTAWFDDVSVAQVPRVTMTADRPGNIFRRDDVLAMQVLVNDRFTDDLAAQLVIRDAASRVVYQRSGALDISSAQILGPGRKKMKLVLPALKPGWYQAALVMTSQGQLLGEQALDFVLLADNAAPGRPDERFGVIATDLPFDGWSELPQILPQLGAGRVKLAVWSDRGDIQQVAPDAFDELLVRLGELHITPTACLLTPPPQLTRAMGGGAGWLPVLSAPLESWQPTLAYMISRHAMHLDRWQLGADGDDGFVIQPEMRRVYDRIYGEFAQLTQNPDLAMPWPAWYELEGRLPATVALSVPTTVLPHQLPLYMQDIQKHKGHNLSLSLQVLDRTQYGREMQVRDLAQRVVYALSAGAQRIDLPLPFTVRQEGDTLVKQPQELLMVVRTLITALGGAAYRGKVPIADGVEAFVFDKAGQGILVLWDRGNEGGAKQLALHLGDRPMCMDLWGNVRPLIKSEQQNKPDAQVQIELGTMPLILIDVDGPLAQLRASVRFDRPLIESSFKAHTRRVQFTNPYRQAIGGTLKLRAPAGWTLNPPTFTFTLNPGETFDREVSIEFPYNSFAGPKTIHADFALQTERASALTVPLTLTLGLSDVGMQTLALRDGGSVLVQQIITNYGDKAIDYTAFAVLPGQARQERLVTNLGAGKTTIKRYRFTDVPDDLAVRVRVGVKELDGTRILNDEVEVR